MYVTFILAFVFIVAALHSIYYSCSQLSYKHGSDIRVVWYLFSLSSIATFGIAWWASNNGAIDVHGVFHDNTGNFIRKLLHFMLDLNADLIFFTTIVALIVLPQLLSYFLSGLFGCASSPLFITGSLSFFFWSMVKSFASASGVVLAIAIFGLSEKWDGWSLKGAFALFFMSIQLISFSFIFLRFYRETESMFLHLLRKCPDWIQKIPLAMHSWFTRRSEPTVTYKLPLRLQIDLNRSRRTIMLRRRKKKGLLER